MSSKGFVVLALIGAVLASGCATTPTVAPRNLQDTVYSTNKTVRRLDQELSGTVKKLGESTADLSARLDETDRQTRLLQSTVMENQQKLDMLQENLGQLTVTLYRHFNLTPPASTGFLTPRTEAPTPVEIDTTDIVVERTPPAEMPEDNSELPVAAEAATVTPATIEADAPPADSTIPTAAPGDETHVAMYQSGKRYYDNGNYAQALEEFKNYLNQYSGENLSANAQYWKGMCYSKQNMHDLALGEFEKVIKKYPTSDRVPYALRNKARSHEYLRQSDQAISTFEELLTNYPGHHAADGVREHLAQLKRANS